VIFIELSSDTSSRTFSIVTPKMGYCSICLELLPIFIVCLCGNFMGAYSGTVVIGYGVTVTVCDMLGLIFFVVGLMWLMCQGQHVGRFGISYGWFHAVDVSGPSCG
jgi:hypothetical protein